MKRIQLSEHIVKLEYNFGMKISVWIVKQKNGVVLVDTGISLMKNSILKQLKQEGTLKRIVLTHGHPDHVGSLNALLHEHPVPVSIHEIEIPYVLGEAPFPGRKKAQKPVSKGFVQAFGEELFEETGMIMYHTPGHSPGHVALYHEDDDVLIAGDAFMSKKGALKNPIAAFTANMDEAVESGRRVLDEVNPSLVSICHGRDVLLKNV